MCFLPVVEEQFQVQQVGFGSVYGLQTVHKPLIRLKVKRVEPRKNELHIHSP